MQGRKGWLRRMAATGSMLFFLTALVMGVMRLPQVYGHYSDKHTLNRPEYTENEVNVYSYDYNSVGEKLQDMMYYQDRDIELTAMLLPSAVDTEVSDGELRVFMQEELDRLYDLGILFEKVDLAQYTMGPRQLRSVYPANGDRLKGRINYWEVTFQRLENTEEGILILADTDYHKIYVLSMVGADADRNCFALQNWLVKGLKDNGRSGSQLAAELLNSLSYELADYYGGVVPEEYGLADSNEAVVPGEYVENISGTNEAKVGGDDSYADIDYLGIQLNDIVKRSAVGEWYLRLPVLIAIGEENTALPVSLEYDYYNDVFALGVPLSFSYPEE